MNDAGKVVSGITGALSSVIMYLIGPVDATVQGALVLMVIDIVMGVVCALSGKSTKTKNGFLSSSVFREGLTKKCGEMMLIIVGRVLDLITGMSCVKCGVCVALIVNEAISILENASTMGICDVPVINQALEVLKKKGGE